MSTGMVETPENVPRRLSFPQRLVAVFTSPHKLFASLREHPAWLDVLLVTLVVSLIGYAVIQPYIQRDSLERAREAIEKRDGLSDQQRQQAIEQQEKFMTGPAFSAIGYVSVIIVTPVMAIIWALILLLGYGFMIGGRLNFKQAFSAVAHLSLIMTLAGILRIPLVLAKKSIHVATSLALLSPDMDPQSLVYAALNTFDIFTIWTLVILSIGMVPMARVSAGKSRGVAVGILVLVFLISVGGASLGRMFQG